MGVRREGNLEESGWERPREEICREVIGGEIFEKFTNLEGGVST